MQLRILCVQFYPGGICKQEKIHPLVNISFIFFIPCQAVTYVFCLPYSPETFHCRKKLVLSLSLHYNSLIRPRFRNQICSLLEVTSSCPSNNKVPGPVIMFKNISKPVKELFSLHIAMTGCTSKTSLTCTLHRNIISLS